LASRDEEFTMGCEAKHPAEKRRWVPPREEGEVLNPVEQTGPELVALPDAMQWTARRCRIQIVDYSSALQYLEPAEIEVVIGHIRSFAEGLHDAFYRPTDD
jgi:hypothetical protein